MESTHAASSELLGVVRGVRNRYRLKRALLGAAFAVAGSWLVLAATAYAMSAFKYSENAVLGGRMFAALAIVALFLWLVVRPMLPRLADEKVALYLEEHETSLNASVITAVEMQNGSSIGNMPRSSMLLDRLTTSALKRVHAAGDGRAIDAGELKANGGIFAAVMLGAFLLTMFGPQVLRQGVRAILTPWDDSAVPVNMFSIQVTPGNATIAKGGDELIEAKLRGFQAEEVALLVRNADSASWTRLTMLPDSAGRYGFRLFDIAGKTEYMVEANGIRSSTYTLDVSNLPYVKTMNLQYRFPAYTQMQPLDVDSTGDIAALKGTMVRLRVTPTVPTTGGRVVVDGTDTLKLVPTADGRLIAMLRVEKPGFYKVELEGPNGKMVTGSLDYTIDVLPDRAPSIRFTKPGRDEKVLSVDEVYTEVTAEDDYGVSKVDLVFSVNGGEEKVMSLHDGTRALKDISAGYTFMLEGLNLQPGDVVSYYARAADNNTVSGIQKASTDIYFLTVRPYDQDYRQGQGGGGGGGGGGGQQQNDANQLSQKQREIIAATFKTQRDSAQTDKKSLEENIATIRLSQQRLREQTDQLTEKLVQRGITKDSGWKKIAEILPVAAAYMDSAEKKLTQGQTQAALAPEQRALQQLQRAEAVFREIQVSMGQQQGGGGGGGGNRTNAQDLADIFELQKDKMRNQYETVQRGQQQSQQQQQADNEVDASLEKLRQLAARQQQENDRARAKADSLSRMGQSGSSGGQGQRDLAQQAEEEARRLERLAREQQNQNLADAARKLQDAANQMRQSAANGQRQGGSQSQQALQNLQDARRLLDQEKNGRGTRDINDAMQKAQQLADQQKKVESDVKQLQQQAAQAAASGASDQQQQQQQQQQQLRQQIADEKAAMAEGAKQLKSQLDRMALDAQREQKDLSRALANAADTLRGRKVEEKLRFTQQQARGAMPDWMGSAEQTISNDIAKLGEQLQQAQQAAQGQQGQRQQAQTADKARDLVRGVQSLDERMRQRAQQNAQNGQQQNGQQQNGQQQNGQQQNGQQQNGQQQKGQQQGGQQNGQQQAQNGRQGQQQGQQGQQGQQQANGQGGGQQGGQRMGGQRPNNGNPQGGGIPNGNYNGQGARLTEQDMQQFGREAAQRLADAEALRQEIAKQGQPPQELDRAIENLRQLAQSRALEDTRTSADLRTKVIEGLKDFEFGLRRRLGEGDSTRVLLERSGDVPPAYKAHVEEYYRSIGKGKKKP